VASRRARESNERGLGHWVREHTAQAAALTSHTTRGSLTTQTPQDLLEEAWLLLAHLLEALRHLLRVVGVHVGLVRRHLLRELLPLVVGHLREVLLIDLLLHLGWRVLHELLHVSVGLGGINLAMFPCLPRPRILLVHLLLSWIEWVHPSLLLI